MKKLILLIVFKSISAFSQNFYVIGTDDNVTNKCEYVNLSDCSKIQIPLCATFGTSGDISVDASNNLFFINNGRFLFKQNQNETNCIQLGEFPIISQNNQSSVNALVCSNNGKLYAASRQASGTTRLYEYSLSNGIIELGLLPSEFISLGDLFFFENRLFLTCRNQNSTQFYIIEIDLANPQQSSIYMQLIDVVPPFGAFSTYLNGVSKSYLLSRSFVENEGKVYELNIPLQTTTLLGCRVNALLNGADSFYDLSNPLGLKNSNSDQFFVKFNNPTRDYIHIETNLEKDFIESINLYDMYGRKSKEFDINHLKNLPIFEIQTGLYFLQIKTIDGILIKKKLLIKN